jgi:hypothetical protein
VTESAAVNETVSSAGFADRSALSFLQAFTSELQETVSKGDQRKRNKQMSYSIVDALDALYKGKSSSEACKSFTTIKESTNF